jgi:hypothetical protein
MRFQAFVSVGAKPATLPENLSDGKAGNQIF